MIGWRGWQPGEESLIRWRFHYLNGRYYTVMDAQRMICQTFPASESNLRNLRERA